MDECSTGELIGSFVFFFLLIVLIHAAPMAWLFKRWGYRYYLGLLPAAFCAMGAATYLSFKVSCGTAGFEHPITYVAAAFYAVCYLLLVFFKPDMAVPGEAGGEVILPFILSIPSVGAVAAVVWLLLSLGRDRLLMVTGKETTLRYRAYETLALGVIIILGGAYVAYRNLD
ncbi:hypothetical protein [Pelagibius sp. 7325]|uniref:hypothetical protein n=1 Tax=Pelagibius sp. 7325 TaxID=3131994 RepID=UPI0030EB8987